MSKWVNTEHQSNKAFDKNVSYQTVRCTHCYAWEIAVTELKTNENCGFFSFEIIYFLKYYVDQFWYFIRKCVYLKFLLCLTVQLVYLKRLLDISVWFQYHRQVTSVLKFSLPSICVWYMSSRSPISCLQTSAHQFFCGMILSNLWFLKYYI